MERIYDKLILLALSVLIATFQPLSTPLIVALLVAVSVSALYEVSALPAAWRLLLLIAYLVFSMFLPAFLVFLPLVAYDCFQAPRLRTQHTLTLRIFRLAWLVPLLIGLLWLPLANVAMPAALAALACLLAWRNIQLATTLASYRARRDELSAASQALEKKNADLEERQSLQLRLATLAERSRIAREIHDNVGHLLTRSILQMEAIQVIHAADQSLAGQLSEVNASLHEAYDSVRQSVHSLHDEAFELRIRLLELIGEIESLPRESPDGPASPLQVELDCELQSDAPPPAVSYALLAIVREALTNTLKHSNAAKSRVSIQEFPGLYQLSIKDDGSKKPPLDKSSPATPGIGLASMEERAQALGGVLNTSWDQGFRVFVSIPKGA